MPIQQINPLSVSAVSNTAISGRITGTQLASTAVTDSLGYTPPNSSGPNFTNNFTQFAVGSNIPFIMRGGVATGPGSNWQTVWTFNEYSSTAFMVMVSYENNAGDGQNRSAIFVDSGSSSYGGGFGVNRLTGSDVLECRRSGVEGARTLQVRHNSGSSDSGTYLQWQLFLVASTQG